METYIGTKLVQAEPCKAWKQSGDWCIGADGYKVRYTDGYVSWSPKEVFEKAYVRTDADLSFGDALIALKLGRRLARKGWNGKGMYVYLVSGSKFTVNRAPLNELLPEGTEVDYRPHLDMRYADGTFGVWLAAQSDILATDWYIVED